MSEDIPEGARDAEIIVTNPPYGQNNKFLTRLYQIGKPFLILCPLTLLETKKRAEMINEFGLSLHVIPHRVKYTATDATFNTSWFSHKCGHPLMTMLLGDKEKEWKKEDKKRKKSD